MRSGSSDRRAVVVVVTLLLVAMVAPSAALVVAWSRDDTTEVVIPRSEYVLAGSARSVTVSATARPVWSEAVVVRAPAWDGVVTAVLAVPGSVVSDGDPVARIDGVEVRYVTLGSPLHRAVCSGDEVLVDEVRTVLAGAGLRTGTSERLSAADLASLRRYAEAIGVPGARDVTCFDPSWVLVGTSVIGVVETIELQVGAPVPAQGDPVLVGRTALESVTLSGSSGATALDDALTTEGSSVFAATEIAVNGRALGVGVAGLGSSDGLAVLASALSVQAEQARDGAGERETTTVAITLTLADSQFVVPATAVLAPLSQQPCVVVAGTAVHVEVLTSSISGLVVDFGAAGVPTSIDLSPGDVACG